MLVPAALKAVKKWRYIPRLLNGQHAEVVTVLEVRFDPGLWTDSRFRLSTKLRDWLASIRLRRKTSVRIDVRDKSEEVSRLLAEHRVQPKHGSESWIGDFDIPTIERLLEFDEVSFISLERE